MKTEDLEYNKELDQEEEAKYNELYRFDLFETLANDLRPY